MTSVDPTSSPADPAAEQTLTSSFAYDGLGRATRQAIAEPHHANRLLQLDVKLGLTTPVAAAGVHIGVDVTGQPCSDPQDNSATCRTSLTPFAGHPVDVSYDGLTPVAWADTTSSRALNTLYGPEGVDQQTDTRYGLSYLHLDLLGSPRALTNTVGATVAAGAYDDWGQAQPGPGQHQIGGLLTGAINLATGLLGGLLGTTPRPPFASVNSATPVGYTSQLADPAQGLLHFHARSYQPHCGDWLQADTWGGLLDRPASLNKYGYTENNPTTYTDLLGYMRPTDDGGPGSGSVCPFGYNGDGSCVYGPVYVPPTFTTWGPLPTPTPDPILSKPPLPVGGNCDNGSVGRDTAAIRRCAASVDCAANTQQAPTQCSSYYNAPGCEQLGACPFGPNGRCITGSENVCPKFGTTPEDYLRWWQAQLKKSPNIDYFQYLMKGDKWAADRLQEGIGCATFGLAGAEFGVWLPIVGSTILAGFGCAAGYFAARINGI